jgi:glyoxylase-like metal-dependent hydrolase (beta-lactamase superfamily II)
MTAFAPAADAPICVTCGTQYPPAPAPPDTCPICTDERQYIPASGQEWTTLAKLGRGRRNAFQRLEPNLFGLGTMPSFAIGQRALLVRTSNGNVLWDCISLLDTATTDIITALGGLEAIAISHPHYYTTMVEWAHAFGAPVLLHERDRRWVMRPDDALVFWEGEEREVLPGLTLWRCGGHFSGGTILHWAAGAEGRGALLTGDIIQVVPDRRFVSFMRSYPNLIPLPPAEVRRIAAVVEPLRFDRIYGAWWDLHVERDAHRAVRESARRYIEWSTR